MTAKTLAVYTAPIQQAERKFLEIARETGNLVSFQREAMFALQAIERDKYLPECDPATIRNAIINVASVGLSLNPATKYTALIARKQVCCLDIMYQGLLKLATDSGSILWAKALLVRATDQFEYLGPAQPPLHRFDPFAKLEQRGAIIGGYTIAKLHNADQLVDTMSLEDIERVRDTSTAKDGPWKTWFDQMALKTLIKRAQKSWPRTDRLARGIEILNEHEGLTELTGRKTVNVTDAPIARISVDQATELSDLIDESQLQPGKIYAAFNIARMEDLPAGAYASCKARLQLAVEARQAKEARS